MNFTNDELNLMCIYATGPRAGLMDALATMKEQLEPDETELRAMTDSALKKLGAMTDEEFSQLALFPDFDDEEDANSN